MQELIKRNTPEISDRFALEIEDRREGKSIQRYQIRKFIGAYVAAMDGVDAIVFTGGIGENTCDLREDVCNHLTYLGVKIDSEKNLDLRKGKEGELSTPDSKVRVFVLPTNEELLIARDTKAIVEKL